MTLSTTFLGLRQCVTSRRSAVLPRSSGSALVVSAISFVSGALVLSTDLSARAGPQTRTVFFDTFPIAQKIRPDDKVVVVEMHADEAGRVNDFETTWFSNLL